MGDVDIARFFPSGEVLLSAALDRTLRVWVAQSGQCATVMTGHQQRMTGLELIDRGRQFITSSLDGTVRLWDCGRGKAIAEFALTTATNRTTTAAVNAALVLRPDRHPTPLSSGGQGELGGYEGWVVMAACEDGHVRGYDMRVPSASSPVVDVITGVAVTSLTQSAPHTLTFSLSNGYLTLLDLRAMQPLHLWRRERDVAIVRVDAESEKWLWSADELGVVTRWDVSAQQQPTIERELTGIDMEPVRDWSFQRDATGQVKRIATAADAVRVYDV